MEKQQIESVLKKHKDWLSLIEGGERANLCGADLRGADLRDANLRGADLRDANLCDANLCDADLRGANLCDANLCDADLRGANLCNATLRGANLRGANLCDATLRGADLTELQKGQLSITPDGDLIGWKKCKGGVIVKLKIPSTAKRSNATGRKCRAELVEVLEVFGAETGISSHDNKTVYVKGQTVKCDSWCEDRWIECAGGIHFFITRTEAENY